MQEKRVPPASRFLLPVRRPARIRPARPPMLAPLRRQNLISPPSHANSPARIPPGDRPCWRRPAGKTSSHHRATPTGWPESRPAADHVGAAPPANPYLTTEPRQQSGPNPARRPTMLAPPCRQSLIPPPSHANRPAQNLLAGRPCWRLAAVKTLSHRRATPTGHLESCPAAVHVGAPPPAKPYPTARPRQQSGPNPARRLTMLALPRRQNLIPPPGHANRPARISPGGRLCWRPSAGKALCHRRATPTGRPKSRLAAAHVGASPPAKPYPTAEPRQQAAAGFVARPFLYGNL